MARYPEADCIVKVNLFCEACREKSLQFLHSPAAAGVYAVNIDVDTWIASIYGTVDSNIDVKAAATCGGHPEGFLANPSHHPPTHGGSQAYHSGYYYSAAGYPNGHRSGRMLPCGAAGYPNGYRHGRALPYHSYGPCYSRGRAMPVFPVNPVNYSVGTVPPARYLSSYVPPPGYDPYDHRHGNCCTMM